MNKNRQQYLNYLNTVSGALKYLDFKKVLYTEIDTLVTSTYPLIKEYIHKKQLNILDVGGGEGYRIMNI